MTVGVRVKLARKRANLSQLELAKLIGVKQPTISELERGESQSSAYLIKIAEACNVNPIWLQNGGDAEFSKSDEYSVAEHTKFYKSDESIGSFDVWDSSTPLGSDEVELPFFKEIELSAGNGSSVVKQDSGFKLRFAKSTLKRHGINPEQAACVTVHGNSMQPVLPDKATVGIDISNVRVKDGEMYAVDHDGLLRVKILYRLPGGGYRIRSYNRDEYPDEDIQAENAHQLKILGKVFWYSVMI